jgi:hypothetical protein
MIDRSRPNRISINALRAHMAELGIVAAQGREGLKQLLTIIASDADERLPADAHASLVVLAAQLQALQKRNRLYGFVSASRHLHRANCQGREASRPASAAVHQVRICDQFQDCEGEGRNKPESLDQMP